MKTLKIKQAEETIANEKKKLLSHDRYMSIVQNKMLSQSEIQELSEHRGCLNRIRCAENFLKKDKWD